MTPAERQAYIRKVVLFCVLDGRPFSTVKGLGYKMLVGYLAPAAVSSTPSPETLDAELDNIYMETRSSVIQELAARHKAFVEVGYAGAFCSLQLDLTTVANQEFATVSTTIIHHVTGEQETYSLCTRVFVGSHKEPDIKKFIEEVRTIFIGPLSRWKYILTRSRILRVRKREMQHQYVAGVLSRRKFRRCHLNFSRRSSPTGIMHLLSLAYR